MARWDVGGFTTATTATTHGLLQRPEAVLALAGSTASPDTTQASVAPASVGLAISTALGDVVIGQYGAFFAGTSAQTQSALSGGGSLWAATDTAGNSIPALLTTLSSAAVGRSASGAPAALAVLGGDDVTVSPVGTTGVSTVASTQASTGYGFQPNAAIVLGQSFVSSVANFSFGFACQTSDGTIKQWSIDQGGREGSLAQVFRSASTAHALKLHTTGSTAHAVSVSSFKADGLELTVDATDTARPATISVLGLKVPAVDAGKSTITTNGAGAGQTGFTVTGLGPNVGLALLASIWTSLQTLQADNAFSIGFASSNGNQRSVSGYVQQGAGNSSLYASLFNTGNAMAHTSAAAGSGALNPYNGALAVTTDGFKVTMSNTAANGVHVYWAAFSNVVSDIGASIQSSFSAAAGPHEVQRIGSILGSSFNASAGIKEVDRIGASIGAVFSEALGLTPDFFPGEGKYHGHSHMDVGLSKDASEGLGRGMYEELSERYRYDQENTSSPDLYKTLSVTTERQRLGVAEFGNAKFLRILAPSTNTVPLRLAAGRGGSGMLLGREMTVFTLADRGGSDVYLFTTSGSVPDVMVRIE